MNKDADILLCTLKPEIDKKCAEIKEKRAEKKHNIIFLILLSAFLLIPSILIFAGISLWYFAAGAGLAAIVTSFVKLPDILKGDGKEVCYE